MKPEPFSFQYPIADFDLTKLPVDPALLRENHMRTVDAWAEQLSLRTLYRWELSNRCQ